MVGEANSSARRAKNRKKPSFAVFFSYSRSILQACKHFRFTAFLSGG